MRCCDGSGSIWVICGLRDCFASSRLCVFALRVNRPLCAFSVSSVPLWLCVGGWGIEHPASSIQHRAVGWAWCPGGENTSSHAEGEHEKAEAEEQEPESFTGELEQTSCTHLKWLRHLCLLSSRPRNLWGGWAANPKSEIRNSKFCFPRTGLWARSMPQGGSA